MVWSIRSVVRWPLFEAPQATLSAQARRYENMKEQTEQIEALDLDYGLGEIVRTIGLEALRTLDLQFMEGWTDHYQGSGALTLDFSGSQISALRDLATQRGYRWGALDLEEFFGVLEDHLTPLHITLDFYQGVVVFDTDLLEGSWPEIRGASLEVTDLGPSDYSGQYQVIVRPRDHMEGVITWPIEGPGQVLDFKDQAWEDPDLGLTIEALYGLDPLEDLIDKALMAWLWDDSLVLALEDLSEDPLDLGASGHIQIWTFGGLVYVSWWWD